MVSTTACESFDLVVVGAGAAGQMAAIAAAEAGRRVVLLEQMRRPGLKMLASGGGRCNLTNLVAPEDFQAAFGRQGRFMAPALELMGPARLRQFMDGLGVPTEASDGRHVFPVSQRAADVQAALTGRLHRLGVQRRLGRAAARLWIDNGRLRGVEAKGGGRLAAGGVVLACGGRSWPKLGGTGGGYALAEQAGHDIAEPVPALVPLVTAEKSANGDPSGRESPAETSGWPARLAGVSLKDARVRIDLPGQNKAGLVGDVLFTHRGVSGPAALDISGAVAELLRGRPSVPLRMELVAGVNPAQWSRRVDEWRTKSGRRRVVSLLRQHLPESLCLLLCERAGIAGQTAAAHVPAEKRDLLARLLGGLELTVTGTEGFDAAFVTRGGVKLRHVDPQTLRSRLLPGLYLAGEMLDLDGPCGGYNLQWAFASGYLAGKSAAAM